MCAPQPNATGPSHSHAGCDASRAAARHAAPTARAESPSRRSRDPREHRSAAVAVGPVRRVAGEKRRLTPGLLASRFGSRRSGEPRAGRPVRRRSDDVCSRTWPDRLDSDRSGHRRGPRGWNNCPRSRATNQSGRRARANPGAHSESDPTHPGVATRAAVASTSSPIRTRVLAGASAKECRCEVRRQCRSDTRDPIRVAVRLLVDGRESVRAARADPTTHLEAALQPCPDHATSPTRSGFGGFVRRS